MGSCFSRFAAPTRAAGKAAEVVASLPQFEVGNVVNGLTVAALAGLFSIISCHNHILTTKARSAPSHWKYSRSDNASVLG
jgi:hypothetical protein